LRQCGARGAEAAKALIHAILFDAVWRAGNVVFREAGQNSPALGNQLGQCKRDSAGLRTALPNSHQPYSVAAELAEPVPFSGRHIRKLDPVSVLSRQALQPNECVDLVDDGLRGDVAHLSTLAPGMAVSVNSSNLTEPRPRGSGGFYGC